jgi:hypothetical protein
MSSPAETGDDAQMTVTEAEPIEGEVMDDATEPQHTELEAAPDDVERPEDPDAEDEPEPPTGAIEGKIVQPDEVDKPTGVVEIRTPHGFLSLRPNQTGLDEHQHSTLLAIGIDIKKDPGVFPHLRAFIHMCQLRHLDPFAKEAYLIGRGTGDWRKWTMQTSIDGYRKLSASTGRFIRVKARLWTGQDDDESCWREVEEDGVLIRKRVWFDQWPESRGFPGSSMAIIEHYDERGEKTTTAATADWKFYAPYSPKYEGKGQNRRKVLDAEGHEIMELSEMWEKGYAHMLVKCAEALAHRLAFPNTVNGFYVAEEMHRLDQEERNRQVDQQHTAARKRIADAHRRALPAESSNAPAGSVLADARVGEPVSIGQAARETVDNLRAGTRAPVDTARAQQSVSRAPGVPKPEVDDAQRLSWLRAEAAHQAATLEMSLDQLFARQISVVGKVLGDFTADELGRAVIPLRPSVIARMREQGQGAQAAAYETVPTGAVMPLERLLGTAAEDARAGVDPTKPHAYEDAQGACKHCGAFEGEPIHPKA